MIRKITNSKRIGQYVRNDNHKRIVEMQCGTLVEDRGGKTMKRIVFFFLRKGSHVVVTRIELATEWHPKFGIHVCGDQHNKHPDLFGAMTGIRCE